MRKLIKELVGIVANTLPYSEPIYEFGSLQVPGQEGFADLRPFFPDKKYIGADSQNGPGVDVTLNVHKIDLASGSAGVVLLMDTIEHVEFPRKAIEEVYRILKPNGIFVMSSHMKWPIHNHPHDYWRFTPEAFNSILGVFPHSYVDFVGCENFPHTVIGVGFKGSVPSLEQFKERIEYWKLRWNPRLWKKVAKLIIPPVIIHLYGKIARIL